MIIKEGCKINSKHEAGAQMLGYLYQVRFALYMLLKNDNLEAQISIEKFDDVSFETSGTPYELIQLKHHTNKVGSLSNKSVDLWRTLKVWIDMINSDKTLLETTYFVIITTAQVNEGTAAFKINKNEYSEAYSILEETAKNSTNQENKSFYQSFLSMDEKEIKNLLSHIRIISSAPDIVDVLEDIKKILKYSCPFEYLDTVTERVEGWWFKEVIKALKSDDAVIMSQRQLQFKVREISQQYDEDNLPIDFGELDPIDEKDLDSKDRLFLEQLRLIKTSSATLSIALSDYYRASMQRSSWIRQGLLYADELESYERRLKDSWERAFAIMQDNLQEYGNATDSEKEKEGRKLYSHVSNSDIRIRDKCYESYVMHGTYHIMANSLTVGWHIDFIKKLEHLLEGTCCE